MTCRVPDMSCYAPLLTKSGKMDLEEQISGSKILCQLSTCRSEVRAVLVAAVCILIGVLHPLATEATKTATSCAVQNGVPNCQSGSARKVMPFHAATLTLGAQLTSVLCSFLLVRIRLGSVRAACSQLLDWQSLFQTWPLGVLYGVGDFIQTLACNSASAPVVLVVGQCKLLLAALLSKLLLKNKQPVNWLRLLIISCAAAAATDIGATAGEADRQSELYGALLAVTKAALSCLGAVVAEKHFKCKTADFWCISFRVQLMMLCSSVFFLPWTLHNWKDFSVVEFFRGGPEPLCSEVAGADSLTFRCIDRKGWDLMTVIAVVAIVLNGLSTGLILRFLSAVTKSVCNALGAGVFYIVYVLMGFRVFNLAQANVMAIVVISSYEYAMEKTPATKRSKASMHA